MRFALVAQVLAATMAVLPMLGVREAGADEPRVGPAVSHDNLTIFLLRGRSAEGPVPLTLAEGLDKGVIDVHETGNVQELEIENKGAEPVFVQLGDIVKGGRQDRVLTVSLLLGPKSGRTPVGAYCVEQGRWTARGTEDPRKFAASASLLPSREAKVAIAKPIRPADPVAVAEARQRSARSAIEAELNGVERRQAARHADQQSTAGGGRADSQGEVWRNVDALQRQLSANLTTSVASERSRTSLQLSLENTKLAEAQATYVTALEPAGLKEDDVVGVAIAIGGRIASAELYPSNGLFRKMWPKIVRAAATEALALKDKPQAGQPTGEAVSAFLATADKAPGSERTLGSIARLETREADTVLSVRAMAPKGDFVHRSYMAK